MTHLLEKNRYSCSPNILPDTTLPAVWHLSQSMAVPTNGNPKPFTCASCKRTFVSFEKLNHHAHKEHGVPRNLSLNINGIRSTNHLQPPETMGGDTPTPTRLMGELGDITGLPRDVGDLGLPMSSMLADYNLTPSVFDQDFKLSIGNIAEKGAPASARISKRASPRANVKAQAAQQQTKQQLTVKDAAGTSVTTTTTANGLTTFTAIPKSPGAFFLTHINANGQYVSSPVLPMPGSPLMSLQPAGAAMQMPFQFPASPMMRPGGFMFAPAISLPVMPAIDPLTNQLQALWANSTLDSSRDSNTPKTEVSSNEEKDAKTKKRPAKRKADEMDDSISDSVSIHSEMSSATPARRARPILETDDPALADKRRRNRIAAEKCRIKRKDRQSSLENENDQLKEKIRQLEKNTAELTRISKEVVKKLQTENAMLKAENAAFRRQLGVGMSLTDGQQTIPSTAGFPLIFKQDSDDST